MNGPLGGGNGSDETEWKEGRGRWKVRYIQDLLRPWFVSGGLCVCTAESCSRACPFPSVFSPFGPTKSGVWSLRVLEHATAWMRRITYKL